VGIALRFRSDAPPRIEVSATEGRSEWVVSVRDNGIGVDREHARRIFAMFSRVDRRGDGNGIGLAVCRRVVEAHGGGIWVEPGDGGGSLFRFTLPFEGDPRATV
jgi:signal transduction histidine kinase